MFTYCRLTFYWLISPIDHPVSQCVGHVLVPSYVKSLRSSPNILTITVAFVFIDYIAFFWIRSEIFNNSVKWFSGGMSNYKLTAPKVLSTVSKTWFSKSLASFPKYGSLKFTAHLFGPCFEEINNVL